MCVSAAKMFGESGMQTLPCGYRLQRCLRLVRGFKPTDPLPKCKSRRHMARCILQISSRTPIRQLHNASSQLGSDWEHRSIKTVRFQATAQMLAFGCRQQTLSARNLVLLKHVANVMHEGIITCMFGAYVVIGCMERASSARPPGAKLGF